MLRGQVRGVHFCQAGGGSITPKNLSIHLHRQLSSAIDRFDQAFAQSLPELVRIEAEQRVEQAAAGARVTNLNINHLSLGDFGDKTSFFRLLHDPLVELYDLGHDEPMLLLVDSLDEAATYGLGEDRPGERESEKFTILDLLNTLKNLPTPVRFLATTRPDPRLLKAYFGAPTYDLIDSAEATREEVRVYAHRRLQGFPEQDRRQLADKVADASGGIFLYADLVVNDLLNDRYENPLAEAFRFPPGMTGYYHTSLTRELGAGLMKRWEDEFKPLLGLVAVGQDQGLDRVTLERIRGQQLEGTLKACMQYLEGDPQKGPYRPFHKSFTDFLLADEENDAFHIDAWSPHADIADDYWGNPNGKPDYSRWDRYAYANLPLHLYGASEATIQEVGRRQAARLARLVASQDFQKRHQVKVNDRNRLRMDIEMALQLAIRRKGQGALPLVVRTSLALYDFHQESQKPARVFDLAEEGKVDEALRQLNMLKNVEPFWQKVALLLVAWLAAEEKPDQSREIVDQAAVSPPFPWPLEVLAWRAGSGPDGDLSGLPSLPGYYPNKEEVEEILKRAGGQAVNESMISEHLNIASEYIGEQFVEAIGQEGHSFPEFLASQDGMPLVAYAVHYPDEDWVFEQYLRIHAANRYVQYRNLALRQLSDAVLRHPSQAWTLRTMRLLAQSALAGGGVTFTGAFKPAHLALRAASGEDGALGKLDDLLQTAIDRAAELTPQRNRTDQWGEHKRRLAALAEAYAFMRDEPAVMTCLQAAHRAPDGFAGYMYTTWLTLADTVCILGMEAAFSVGEARRQALLSARNIQDSTFSAWAVARVNAMLAQPWRSVGVPIQDLVPRFCANPEAPEFAPFYIIGDPYRGRDRSQTKIPLSEKLEHARSMEDLSLALGAPLGQLAALNPVSTPSQALPPRARVRLPDPAFIPLLAGRLSAEVQLADDLFPEEKQPLIQMLVPLTLADRTALETVLARLLLAAGPEDQGILNALRQAYGLED
jgi:hypothetical protein